MDDEFTKFKQLQSEYLRLLEISSFGESRKNLYQSKGIPLGKLGKEISFLEKEIIKLKDKFLSEGIIF